MFLVTTKMTVFAQKREELYQTFATLIPEIRAKEGCLSCQFLRGALDENEICIMAEWDTQENIVRYLDSEHFNIMLGTTILLKNPPDVTLYTVCDFTSLSHEHNIRAKTKLKRGRK